MFRSTHTSVLDNTHRKVVVRIESEVCVPETVIFTRNKILDNIAMNPTILENGTGFQTMRMYFTGERWIVETEALVEGI